MGLEVKETCIKVLVCCPDCGGEWYEENPTAKTVKEATDRIVGKPCEVCLPCTFQVDILKSI